MEDEAVSSHGKHATCAKSTNSSCSSHHCFPMQQRRASKNRLAVSDHFLDVSLPMVLCNMKHTCFQPSSSTHSTAASSSCSKTSMQHEIGWTAASYMVGLRRRPACSTPARGLTATSGNWLSPPRSALRPEPAQGGSAGVGVRGWPTIIRQRFLSKEPLLTASGIRQGRC